MLIVGRIINGLAVGVCSDHIPFLQFNTDFILDLLCSGPSLYLRSGAAKQTWSTRRCAAMGYYMGHHDHVLHMLRK
jgi:hypothetical protein